MTTRYSLGMIEFMYNTPQKRWQAWLISGALLASLLVGSYPGHARPGGGQSFSSGSSSSGSSSGGYHSSGGGSGGELSPMGIVGVLIFLLILYLISRSKNKNQGRATVALDVTTRLQSIARLKAQDPGFDENAFLERVKATMAQVNGSWVEGNMASSRRLISDGVYVRFQTQLRLLLQQGVRNLMADWKVVSAELLIAESDTHWDSVHVRVTGEARDADVSTQATPEQAQQQLQGTPVIAYQEVWSFVRKRGLQSKTGNPVLEGHCPNCGAELPKSESVQCLHCKAIVNSGEHDWALAEITQPEEWRPAATQTSIPGLEDLQRRDPMVSRQAIEDRASVIFWKWVAARTTEDIKPFQRFCGAILQTPSWEQQLSFQKGPLFQVAVGSVELARVLPMTTPTARDRICVEIVWSALVPTQGTKTFRQMFFLGRPSTAKSLRGFSSLHCTECGGPLPDSDATTCAYCGASIAPEPNEWLLEQVS